VIRLAPLLTTIILAQSFAQAAEKPLPEKIVFNRDVRPILSENCFKCHGPDQKARKAERRLDTREGALAENEGIRAIVPGNLTASELHMRIHSEDKEERMPPPKSGKKITPRQIVILDKWIEQGAEYQAHWAYLAPVKAPVPQIEDAAFVRNPIDAFVLARQRELGLEHAPEADARTLCRRLYFDLTGLPPKPRTSMHSLPIQSAISPTAFSPHPLSANASRSIGSMSCAMRTASVFTRTIRATSGRIAIT
jgi:hypothetical protein